MTPRHQTTSTCHAERNPQHQDRDAHGHVGVHRSRAPRLTHARLPHVTEGRTGSWFRDRKTDFEKANEPRKIENLTESQSSRACGIPLRTSESVLRSRLGKRPWTGNQASTSPSRCSRPPTPTAPCLGSRFFGLWRRPGRPTGRASLGD